MSNNLLAYARKKEGSTKEAAIQEIESMFKGMSLDKIEEKIKTIAAIANFDSDFTMNHRTALDLYTAINYESEEERAKKSEAVIPEGREFYMERFLSEISECLLYMDDTEYEILSEMIKIA